MRLLAAVARSHGVIPEKYQVSKAKDGSDRIKCGTRNLNVSDFLTRVRISAHRGRRFRLNVDAISA